MKKLAGKPFVLLGVNSDADREELNKAIAEEGINWRSWWDEGIDGPIHTQWQIELRPAIHLIDAEGVIRHRGIAPQDVDEAIDDLLAELAGKNGG